MLDLPPLIQRRDFLRLMSAALALASGGCVRRPAARIVPYAQTPSGLTPGEPQFYATALTQGGYAHGVLVRSDDGRPTKIEGNPAHPASLGATGPIEQGRILELWNPARSHAPLQQGLATTWQSFTSMLAARLAGLQSRGGAGLYLLTGATSSPTLRRQWQRIAQRYPAARWHVHEAVDRDAVRAGAMRAFGAALEPVYRFHRARIVAALDADFLAAMPGAVRHARDFARARSPEQAGARMNRLYAAECMPSVTGAAADHRLPLRTAEILELAQRLEARLAGNAADGGPPWFDALLADLAAHRGESLVVAGEAQPAEMHELACRINARLGNIGRTVDFIAPPPVAGESLAALVEAMRGGTVDTLLVLGANPAYDAPADLEFSAALGSVPLSVHCGLYVDETARLCHWHLPAAHELESWSDARAFDGTACIQQPLIAPLYGGYAVHEVLALLSGEHDATAHGLVQATWRETFGNDFETSWQQALQAGVIAGSASSAVKVALRAAAPAVARTVPRDAHDLELNFRPDPCIWDGRYADIPWLQELPRPLTQLTWDNAALLAPELAVEFDLHNEDVVELWVADRRIEAPVWIVNGHAPRAVTLYLGFGRRHAGDVGSGRGVDPYALRTSGAPWFTAGLGLRSTGTRVPLATVQHHHRMEEREPVRSGTLSRFLAQPDFAREAADRAPPPTLYPDFPYEGHAWGMTIDLAACIGCNACTIACQAENNIPTVGKDEVLRGREMHWIRVDRYEAAPQETGPHTDFQPVPCMQCEHAPCEVVCPVEASVHDAEGINVQVYNRCVGTRFCSNNCPYKVRRFNFLQYARDAPGLDAQRNPEVTVRNRGVMEKCNYCLQRIVRGRIAADRDNRRIADGEVVTACQAVCPTQAIVFGDLNDPASRVRANRELPRNYALLGELDTRPRTTYLAKITHPREPDDAA
ncbi:MAG TPA: 4Fe-4S dicluster domain-containing protein [Steroidobacteraceae bacterium]|nr:4Fe-4S dicluster domain-containing protein [Steroidobacteraceae bacterium]